MNLKEFLKECNNRGVFKMLSIYIVSSWVVLQVLSVVAEPLGLPEKSVTYLIILLLVGLPIYMLYLWKSRMRYVKSDANNAVETNIKKEIQFKRTFFMASGLIALIAVISVFFIVKTNFTDGIKLLPIGEDNKIAVLNFDNNTADASLDVIGKMASEWLIDGITANDAGEVISSKAVDNYSNLLGVQISPENSKNILDKFFNPGKLILGSYFVSDSTLIFNCRIQDGSGKSILKAFEPITCNKKNPLECIDNLKQEVVGYLFTTLNKDSRQIMLEQDPPKFEAYKRIIQAESIYDNPERYIELISEAIAIDSDYFYPKVLKVQHYYNMGDYQIADSLIKQLDPDVSNKKQANFHNYLKALIDRDSRNMYKYMQNDYALVPFDVDTNSSLMTIALQYLNQPDLVEELFNAEDIAKVMEETVVENCTFCLFRYNIMGKAYNELGAYQKTKDLLIPLTNKIGFDDNSGIYYGLAQAYAKSGDASQLSQFMDDFRLTVEDSTLQVMNLFIGKTFLVANDSVNAHNYIGKVLQNGADDYTLAEAYYYKSDYINAEKLLNKLHKADPNNYDVISKLAVSKYKNGKKQAAQQLIDALDQAVSKYLYGDIDYAKAQYYAGIGDKEKALEYVRISIANGKLFWTTTFQNDPHFVSYLSDPKFQDYLTYWH